MCVCVCVFFFGLSILWHWGSKVFPAGCVVDVRGVCFRLNCSKEILCFSESTSVAAWFLDYNWFGKVLFCCFHRHVASSLCASSTLSECSSRAGAFTRTSFFTLCVFARPLLFVCCLVRSILPSLLLLVLALQPY